MVDLFAAVPGASVVLDDTARTAMADILDAAQDWWDGKLPLEVFAAIGAVPCNDIPSCGYGRFLARWRSNQDDPRIPALDHAIDALIAAEGTVMTKQGMFTRRELAEAGAVVSGGRRVA